ncbi:MAG TPA: hypothetical protein VEF03_07620 [Candidatus Binataceae bacterium]|nr:hypothetical protein [Candidatus Binataceae bacterium]
MANPRELDQDDLKLRELGFDASAPASEAIARLRELESAPGVSAPAIARALGSIASQEAADSLAEMETHASGALRREIRRSLFRLEQRGIKPSQALKTAPSQTVPPAAAEPGLIALMSPVDPEGAQIVWLVKSRPQGGVIRVWALVCETEGLVGANATNLSRREFRAQRESLEREAEMKLVETDPRLADFIVCEAYRNTPESRRARVGNFLQIRAEAIASPPPPADMPHPIYAEFASEIAAEPSADLMKELEIASIRIPPSEFKTYLDEVNRAQESLIVVSPTSQQERIMAVLDRAVRELISGERARRLRRRLENTAYYMMKTGRRQQAGWAAAAAARIRDGADLAHVPFFRALVQTHLGTMIAEQSERRAEEPHLIMTPAEAMRAQQRAAEARARGPRR